jgi:hypothetical protein
VFKLTGAFGADIEGLEGKSFILICFKFTDK